MYQLNCRVRYSETDRFGNITPDAIVNYFQDVCMAHSESVGLSVHNLENRQGVWMLSSWQIDILDAPRFYDKITVTTNPYDFKGFYGYRNFSMTGVDDKMLIKANSIWVFLDKENFMPKRVPAEEVTAYESTGIGEKLSMDYLPRKIKVPDNMKTLEAVDVTIGQLDTNNHVNNCEYIKTAMDVTGLEKMPCRLRVEYKAQAHLGDKFYPYIYEDDDKITVDLRNGDGTSYAVVEFWFRIMESK